MHLLRHLLWQQRVYQRNMKFVNIKLVCNLFESMEELASRAIQRIVIAQTHVPLMSSYYSTKLYFCWEWTEARLFSFLCKSAALIWRVISTRVLFHWIFFYAGLKGTQTVDDLYRSPFSETYSSHVFFLILNRNCNF